MGSGELIEGIFATGGVRLDKALADASGLSRERVKALLGDGHITLAGKPATSASAKAVAGMAFAIAVPPAAEATAAPQDIPLVVAKNDAAHEGLARQFADHSIERAYFAVVNGHPRPAAGTVNARIGRSSANRKKMAVLPDDTSRGKHAITHFKTLKLMENCALIECRLETGRTHQVRVHMTSIGHALLGDPLYGRPHAKLRPILTALRFHRQALHAAVLGVVHPITGDTIRFESELPQDMRELIDETAR